jgi:hypothetical protein
MERRFFRSTSTEHLMAELRRHELLRDAELSGRRSHRPRRGMARLVRHRALGHGLRLLIRRMAG